MSLPRVLRTQQGQQITLGKQLGSGGEGIVYEVQGIPSIAAKIYHPDKATEREHKIRAMVSAGWHKTASTAALPVDALFAGSDSFVGFTMPLVSGQREIHDLYSPTSRRTAFPAAGFRFLLRTSLNIARAVAGVHGTGCVIGDLNQSGILIAKNAMATLIDCDSFQVTVSGRTFPCKVGKEEFTPPELQGIRFDQIVRTSNHDAFGLAVIIFYLLFMGRHPFDGKFVGRGDVPPRPKAIAEYRFAYSSRTNDTRMVPPPHVPLLSDLPKELSDAFEIAFGPSGPSRRPTAADWVLMLERAELQVVGCQNNSAHHFFRAAPSCPWCRMEAGFPGFLAFAPQISTTTFKPVNLAQLIATLRGISDPGLAPELSTGMPTFVGAPTPVTANLKRLAAVYGAALVGVFILVLLLRAEVISQVFALLPLCVTVFLAVRQPPTLEALEKATAQSAAAWKNIEARWHQAKDNRPFLEKRRDADQLALQLQGLSGEENRQLGELKIRQREAQLAAFLQRFFIDDPRTKIKGVGGGRAITLRSYGIETAADVDQNRIQQIDGFGPVITGAIVAWRRSLERQFVFNPNQPINPADIAAIKSKIAREYSQLEQKLRAAVGDLQTCANQLEALRTQLRTAAASVWNAKCQADLDAGTYLKMLSRRNRLIAIAIVSVAALLIPFPTAPVTPVKPGTVSSQYRDVYRADNEPKTTPTAQQRPELSDTRNLNSAAPKTSPPTNSPLALAPSSPTVSESSADGIAAPPSGTGPAIPGPIAPNAPTKAPRESVSVPESLLEPLTTDTVLAIQTRLKSLGFAAPLTGAWDGATRDALRDFTVANQLDPADTWNLPTQEWLKSNSATSANRSFVGGWSSAVCNLEPGGLSR